MCGSLVLLHVQCVYVIQCYDLDVLIFIYEVCFPLKSYNSSDMFLHKFCSFVYEVQIHVLFGVNLTATSGDFENA